MSESAATFASSPPVQVYEPNLMHRLVLVRILLRCGVQVQVVEKPEERWQAAAVPGRVAFIDCDKTQPSGYEIAAEIKRLRSPQEAGILLALTSRVTQADRKARKRAGFDNYLEKPLRLQKMQALLARHAPHLIKEEVAPRSIASVDIRALRELWSLVNGQQSLVQEIIHAFVAEAPALIQQMRQAEEDGDGAAVAEAAGILKGLSGTVGATRMEELCGIIRALASAEALVSVGAMLGELSMAFEQTGCDLRSAEITLLAGEESDAAAPRRQLKGNPTVLLAEQDTLLARFLSTNLRAAGMTVEVVEDGPAALAHLASQTVDCLVADAGLPGLDGYHVLTETRLHPKRQHLPVLIISARQHEQEALRAFELGADDFVAQPLSPLEVVARVRSLLRRS
ncbi:MAG: response regulator [Acidobacteria bacterium]|nr:response regulator [Acidobacteriota bacterium]